MTHTHFLSEIFKESPTPTLLVRADSPHFHILDVNYAYMEVTKSQSDHLVGKKLFEAFPPNPNELPDGESVIKLAKSLNTVIQTKKAHTMDPLQYDIPVRDTMDFEVRHWQPKNIPVLNDQGHVELILHTVTDITSSILSNIQFQASEVKYKELVQSMNAIIWEADADTYLYNYVSPQAKNILGYDLEEWYEKDFWKNHVHPEDKENVLSYSLSMIKQNKDHINEYRMITKDMSVVWISDSVSVGVNEAGNITLRGVMTDITARKKFEKINLKNQSKISNIFIHSLDIICTVDAEGVFREVSPASERILGYSPEEMLGNPFLNFVHDDDVSISREAANQIYDGADISTFENRYIHKSGDIVNMLWSCTWDEANQAMYCIGKDGTYKKNIGLQLQYSEQRFKSLVHHGADFIAILDEEGIFTYASLNADSILGYQSDYLIGKNAFSLLHKKDLDRVYALFIKLVQGEKFISDTFRYKNGAGKYQWMETIAIDMRDNPAVGGIVVNSRDISEKKHYLEWHEYVNKATNNTIYDWDIIEDRVQWGGYADNIFEASEKHGNGVEIWKLKLHPEDKDRTIKELLDAITDSDKQFLRAEYKLANALGEYVDIIDDGFLIRDDAGKAIRMIGALRDVTDQKRFESEIQISNLRYALATQATSDAIWDWDLSNNSLYWGDGFQKLFGHNPDELYKDIRSWNKLIHPKDYKRITDEIQNTIDSNATQWDGEYRFLKADGEYVYVYDRGFLQRDADGKAIRMVGAMQDIHKEKLKEVEDSIKLSIGKIFTDETSLETSFKNTLKIILEKTEFSYGEVWLTDFNQKNIALNAHFGKGTYTIEKDDLQLEWNVGMPGTIFSTKKHMFIEEVQTSSVFIRKNFAEENKFKSAWGHPICFNDKVIAVIILYNKYSKKKTNFSTLSTDIFNLLGSEIQRKKAELELNFFFDLSPDFLCIVGMNGRFIKVNHKFEREIGPILKDGIPLTYHEYTHPDDFVNVDGTLEKLKKGNTTYNESRYRTKSGEYIWVGWDTVALVEHGHVFTIGKDITAIKGHKEELENSNNKLSETLESIQDGFFALDFDWKVTYWNKVAERILIAKREDVLGKTLWESFPEAMKLKFFKEYNRAMTERESVNFEEYFPPLSIWFNVSAFPSDSGITVFFKDITESKNESLKLLEFKKVFENSKDEIAIISTVNDDVYLNPAYTESLGYGVEKLKQLGGPQHAFASEDLAAEVFSHLLAGKHWKGDVELITSDRKFASYHISGGPIFDEKGKLVAVFLIHTNISNRKEIEGKLQDLYKNLKLQTKALIDAQKELENFASVASLDFQIPLKNIQNDLILLEKEYVHNEGLLRIKDALKNTDRLQFLINGLWEYTLLGRENSDLEKVDLNDVLADANKSLRKRITDKFAIIDIPKMPVVKGHKIHLQQIFENLIDNSLTYAVERPRVTIDFESGKTHWLFSVRDNGTGFDAAHATDIFNLFFTLDHPNKVNGNGMGLAVSKKVVEMHKGKIWADAEPGKGSTFYFTISKDL